MLCDTTGAEEGLWANSIPKRKNYFGVQYSKRCSLNRKVQHTVIKGWYTLQNSSSNYALADHFWRLPTKPPDLTLDRTFSVAVFTVSEYMSVVLYLALSQTDKHCEKPAWDSTYERTVLADPAFLGSRCALHFFVIIKTKTNSGAGNRIAQRKRHRKLRMHNTITHGHKKRRFDWLTSYTRTCLTLVNLSI